MPNNFVVNFDNIYFKNTFQIALIWVKCGQPTHTAHTAQNWLQTNCPDSIAKDQWHLNSLDLNHGLPCLGGNVRSLSQATSKAKNDCRTQTLQVIWDSVPQGSIDKAVKEFPK